MSDFQMHHRLLNRFAGVSFYMKMFGFHVFFVLIQKINCVQMLKRCNYLGVRVCVENGPERLNWLIVGHGRSGQVIIELSSRRTR